MRHAKSEWNKLGLWTGWKDVSLSEEGRTEAEASARHLEGIEIHKAYTSPLKRARETLHIVLKALGLEHIELQAHDALKERNYGVFTGKNKWDIQKEIGDEAFQSLRRSWDHPIQEGETLKDVYHRVVPFYEGALLPDIRRGSTALVVAHGNSLRALVKHIEDVGERDIPHLEIGLGEAHVYHLDKEGSVLSKEIRAENAQKGKL